MAKGADGKAASSRELTPKQEKFCQEYMIDLNATQAAIRAGYSEKAARVTSCKMLTNANIQNRIAELQGKLQKRTEITQEMIIAEYAKIAFASITDVMEWGETQVELIQDDEETVMVARHGIKLFDSKTINPDSAAAVAEVAETNTGMKVKMHDKKGALDSLARHLGMFKDKVDHTSSDGTMAPKAPISTEQIKDIVQELKGKI